MCKYTYTDVHICTLKTAKVLGSPILNGWIQLLFICRKKELQSCIWYWKKLYNLFCSVFCLKGTSFLALVITSVGLKSTGLRWWNWSGGFYATFSLTSTHNLLSQFIGSQKILEAHVQGLTSIDVLSGAILWYWFPLCHDILISPDFIFVNHSRSWH